MDSSVAGTGGEWDRTLRRFAGPVSGDNPNMLTILLIVVIVLLLVGGGGGYYRRGRRRRL